MVVKRFDIYLATLDPTFGSEIQKTRPCLVVSPDDLNRFAKTVFIAPMTTKGHANPYSPACTFQGKRGRIVFDQVRAVDKLRLVRKLGKVDTQTESQVLAVLAEMFAP